MPLRTFLVVALTGFIVACVPCSNTKAVALARGLSQPRLAKLYQDVKALGPADRISLAASRDEIPASFRDLNPRAIRSFGDTVIIHLSGCFDDKAILQVEGLDGTRGQQIILVPGETQKPVVLWQGE